MNWDFFVYFAAFALIHWAFGAWAAWKGKRRAAIGITAIGLLIFFSFILAMWITMKHPPLRTIGETRLWYSLFLPLVGLIIYTRWKYRWILSFSTMMATVFICINIFKPEIHTQALMPALQSPWFVPHVIVYMFAYALLGAATLVAAWMLIKGGKSEVRDARADENPLESLINIGLAFMTLGMLFGALWAKEAWGHYWSWDPKETWAAITWMSYLVYLHYIRLPRHNTRIALWGLILCFLLLQMCWWGINYLPSAIGSSVHTYTN